ncbi:MAG: molecular chaperone HscC [Peptostreptococcaceae bacterium]|nr:molecular chaperone HscC [Peptostreptococcaceae bacterium]
MIIGIDLGTTNSLAAYYEDGEAKLIKNRLGEYLTPSVVSVGEQEEIYVGKTALERKLLYPQQTADNFKRSMGTGRVYELGKRKFLAEELSSFVLRSLKEDAEVFLGKEVREAIISVPAYFNDMQRKATKRAGELSGLRVERIISEPTAAAISYGLYQKNPFTKFLVFDLGGGTFDISILERAGSILEVRAVAGDNFLGGEDFTEALLSLFLEKVGAEDKSLTPSERIKLRRQAEAGKIAFSSKDRISFSGEIAGESHRREITSSEYERSCQELLSRIRKPIERSLRDANIKLSDIDEIVLVGGATKMPIIRRFVGKLFGMFPNFSVNPDETVALGVGLEVAIKERNEQMKEIIMTDVCPFTLGTTIAIPRERGGYESGHYFPIIERNTVIPVSKTERLYSLHDNQSSIHVDILQGESRLSKNNLKIGSLSVRIPKSKAGEEAVDLTYTYDVNSLLEVMVKVISTGEVRKIIIQNDENKISPQEAERRMKELDYLKIHPREQEENKLLLFRGERLYEMSIGEKRKEIGYLMQEFEQVLGRQDKEEIEKMRKQLKEILDEIETEEEW